MKKNTVFITQSALIAALYVVMTYISHLFGLANGAVQIRLSEALTVLPAFTISAVPGLFIGCLLSNILTGCALWDILFGSLATLLGALGTYYFGKKMYLSPVFPILANTLIVPPVLKLVYGANEAYLYLSATVFSGEVISCGICGLFLYKALKKTNLFTR